MQRFVSISMHILLSSNVRQPTLVVLVWTLKSFPFSSYSRLMIPITLQRAVDSVIYSAVMVISAIRYCILLAHMIRQLAYIITYPVREWLDKGSSDDRCCHDLAQSASIYHYNRFVLSSLKVIPCALVFNKYLHMHFTDYLCYCNGSLQNLDHCCTAMVIYGRIIAWHMLGWY